MTHACLPLSALQQPDKRRLRPGRRGDVIGRWATSSGAVLLLLADSLFALPPTEATATVPATQSAPVVESAEPAQQTLTTDVRLEQILLQLRDQRLVLALQQLDLATRTHQPFLRELELVRQLGGHEQARLRPALDSLAASAETGVATVWELRDSFGVIVLPKLQALQGNTGPWSDRVRLWLSNVIAPTSPTQPADQNTVGQQLVMSAVDRLAEDDLRSAVDLIGQLTGTPANLTLRWLTEARGRLTVDAAHEALSGTILDLLNPRP
jgi:hypothetical protein